MILKSLIISILVYVASAKNTADDNNRPLYSYVNNTYRQINLMKFTLNELKDKFLLLKTISNFTLPSKLLDLHSRITDMQIQNNEWDIAEIAWIQNELIAANTDITNLTPTMIGAIQSVSHFIITLKNDLTHMDVINVAEDSSNLENSYQKYIETYWKSIQIFDTSIKRINSAVTSSIDDKSKTDSYTNTINNKLTKIIELLEIERISIEESKSRLDDVNLEVHNSAAKIINYISPFDSD